MGIVESPVRVSVMQSITNSLVFIPDTDRRLQVGCTTACEKLLGNNNNTQHYQIPRTSGHSTVAQRRGSKGCCNCSLDREDGLEGNAAMGGVKHGPDVCRSIPHHLESPLKVISNRQCCENDSELEDRHYQIPFNNGAVVSWRRQPSDSGSSDSTESVDGRPVSGAGDEWLQSCLHTFARKSGSSEKDLEVLKDAAGKLDKCGYYYGPMTMPQARKKLKHTQIGSFLLRDSSDPKFLYAISIKTERGTTSVRISYQDGKFCLDCADTSSIVPKFDCVIELVDYYRKLSKSGNPSDCVFVEATGRRDTPVLLTTPHMCN